MKNCKIAWFWIWAGFWSLPKFWSTVNPPAFAQDPIVKPNAGADQWYIGQSLSGSASDLDGNTLSFAKISGPVWLKVGLNGALYGTPGSSDIGLNQWTVEVDDGAGGTDQTTLEITVTGTRVSDWSELE